MIFRSFYRDGLRDADGGSRIFNDIYRCGMYARAALLARRAHAAIVTTYCCYQPACRIFHAHAYPRSSYAAALCLPYYRPLTFAVRCAVSRIMRASAWHFLVILKRVMRWRITRVTAPNIYSTADASLCGASKADNARAAQNATCVWTY